MLDGTFMKNIQYFLIPYILLFIVILAALFQYPKGDLHLLMNSNHTVLGDWFFRIWTEVGGGFVPIIFIVLLLFYRYSYTAYLAVSLSIGGIISLIAKRAFNEPRPLLYFQQHFPGVTLPTVPGVDMYTTHSFPSGHTITAFALFFGLSLIVKNKWLKLLFFCMAALVGYSRVYLSQHFTMDILAGSAIGVFSAWITYQYLAKFNEKWKNRSLSKVFLKKKPGKLAGN